MKMFKKSAVLAAVGALLIAASATAGVVNKQIVVSTNGNPVVSSFGDCVFTNFDSKNAYCNTAGNDIEQRTVYFNFNASKLTPAAKSKLNVLAKSLKSRKVKELRIVGYTDEIGAPSYNLRLSQQRANAVAAYLKGKGFTVKGKSEVRGLGETASKSQCSEVKGNELKACLWRDRRVEVEIVQ